jgi:hypothetical protein
VELSVRMLESAVRQGKAAPADVRAVAEQVVWAVRRKALVAPLELPAGPRWSAEGAAGELLLLSCPAAGVAGSANASCMWLSCPAAGVAGSANASCMWQAPQCFPVAPAPVPCSVSQ